jgi:acetyltransferase-like isoleucine patch superfamily enzyme
MSTKRHLDHDWFPRPLPENLEVAERSWLYSSYAFVHATARLPSAVRVGHDTGIYNGTFFDLGPHAEIEIGNFCTLVGVIIRTDARVKIGDFTFLAHEVVMADSPFAAPPTPQGAPFGPRTPTSDSAIILGENCWVGMGAVLLAGTHLGEGCVVGAGAVVNFVAPPFSIIAGNPARVVGSAK